MHQYYVVAFFGLKNERAQYQKGQKNRKDGKNKRDGENRKGEKNKRSYWGTKVDPVITAVVLRYVTIII